MMKSVTTTGDTKEQNKTLILLFPCLSRVNNSSVPQYVQGKRSISNLVGSETCGWSLELIEIPTEPSVKCHVISSKHTFFDFSPGLLVVSEDIMSCLAPFDFNKRMSADLFLHRPV
jgi:hypothetical protein